MLDILANTNYAGPVSTFSNSVSQILYDNKMPFFPAYTDHGINHVEKILQTQCSLIPEQLWNENQLSPQDISVIICATLLHDLAMHIREDGFVSLVENNTDHEPIMWFDKRQANRIPDAPWDETWKNFCVEIRRYSRKELERFLGANAKVTSSELSLSSICRNNRIWSDNERLLVGEFIRRHHARIAHETAIYGFPGINSGSEKHAFPILTELLPDIANIIGLVARSHGMQLRDCVEYLNYVHSGDLKPRNVLVVYLMALLRISDFLQIDADRAPPVLLQLRQPQSPASLVEWEKHGGVASVSFEHIDPYAIKIELDNNHSFSTHLQLQQLIAQLQSEIDTSVAVLDEVYSRTKEIAIRKTRVRSNIYDPALLDALPFLPKSSELGSDPNLLALLVDPLYGGRPEYGIRELLQNSMDAVRERIVCNDSTTVNDSKLKARIELIEYEKGKWKIVFLDNGVGMSGDTVTEFFLKAGASFRYSHEWKQKYVDEDGISMVSRTGRFGVGVFAGFLLGDEMDIQTRRHDDESGKGLSFKVTQGGTSIKLTKEKLQIGTRIEIPIRQSAASKLELSSGDGFCVEELSNHPAWNWFTGDSELVEIVAYPFGGTHVDILPDTCKSTFSKNEEWRLMEGLGKSYGLAWTIGTAPKLTVNDFRIASILVDYNGAQFQDAQYYWRDLQPVHEPSVSISDPDAQLSVNLRRDEISDFILPMNDELLNSIFDDILAFALVNAPQHPTGHSKAQTQNYAINHPLIKDSFRHDFFFFCTGKGVGILDPWIFSLSETSQLDISWRILADHSLWKYYS